MFFLGKTNDHANSRPIKIHQSSPTHIPTSALSQDYNRLVPILTFQIFIYFATEKLLIQPFLLSFLPLKSRSTLHSSIPFSD